MLTAMARELVENKGIGESADSVWRALGQLRPSTSAPQAEEPVDTPMESDDIGVPESLTLTFERVPTSPLGNASDLPQRSSIHPSETGQLSLF